MARRGAPTAGPGSGLASPDHPVGGQGARPASSTGAPRARTELSIKGLVFIISHIPSGGDSGSPHRSRRRGVSPLLGRRRGPDLTLDRPVTQDPAWGTQRDPLRVRGTLTTGQEEPAPPVYIARYCSLHSRSKPQPVPLLSHRLSRNARKGCAYPALQGFLSLGEPTVCCAGKKDTVPS